MAGENNTTYVYPENMGKKMSLFFWTLRDGVISMGLALLGLYIWLSLKIPVIFAEPEYMRF